MESVDGGGEEVTMIVVMGKEHGYGNGEDVKKATSSRAIVLGSENDHTAQKAGSDNLLRYSDNHPPGDI